MRRKGVSLDDVLFRVNVVFSQSGAQVYLFFHKDGMWNGFQFSSVDLYLQTFEILLLLLKFETFDPIVSGLRVSSKVPERFSSTSSGLRVRTFTSGWFCEQLVALVHFVPVFFLMRFIVVVCSCWLTSARCRAALKKPKSSTACWGSQTCRFQCRFLHYSPVFVRRNPKTLLCYYRRAGGFQ